MARRGGDGRGKERVVIVSQSVARRMFPNGNAVNRHLAWIGEIMKFIDVSTEPRRIIGIAADVDDASLARS